MAKTNKIRIDTLLFNGGLFENLQRAQAVVMSGRVSADNVLITKPGTQVRVDACISIKQINPYVSRGGLKLEGALKHFNISVKDKVCMDIGSSTGGFTDCLLQHGARKVFAIDVGKNQLDEKIRKDPRVVGIEGVNFRYFTPEILKETVEFATIDVSFISLESILPSAVKCLCTNGQILALVKPQFEVLSKYLVKGVVRNAIIRKEAIDKITHFALKINLEVKGVIDCCIKGPKGNLEHFLWLAR